VTSLDSLLLSFSVCKYLKLKHFFNYTFRCHLAAVHGLVDDLQDEVGPDDVQHEQNAQQPVEEVVCREHFDDLWRLDRRRVQDPSGVDAQPGEDPSAGEAAEEHVARALVVRILAHLGSLKGAFGVHQTRILALTT